MSEAQVSNAEFPGLFQAADHASSQAQRQYSRLVAVDLAVMVIAAALGALSLGDPVLRQMWAMASAVCIAASFGLTYALKSERLSAVWYQGRAAAESVKTAAWRYMMRAEPYTHAQAEAEVDRRFGEANEILLGGKPALAGALPSPILASPQITPRMREARALSLDARKALYLASRIREQRDWYASRAEANRGKARATYRMVLACQVFAMIAAIALVRWPDSQINFTGVFTALAAALIGWTQLRKHDELASTYGMSAQRLTSLADQIQYAAEEAQFAEIVSATEETITRENSFWLTRRQS